MDASGPIFVGGTGRSGTSVMADMLNSHSQIVLPAHENKIIVEKDGLKDLIDQLGGRFDMKRRHYAAANFIRWAKTLRSLGFRDQQLNERTRSLMSAQKLDFHKAAEIVARENPAAELSLHAVGHGFDVAHYDSCLNGFISRICSTVISEGIVDTEGLIRPFIMPTSMDRGAALDEARALLNELYSLPMRRVSASRWCDDTPSNWLYFDFLYELYPNMKFIHMIRDPRDVVGSYLKQVWAPADPNVIIEMFRCQFLAYEAIRKRVPEDRVMEVRLEDISTRKMETMESVSKFLGVENKFNADLFFDGKTNSGSYAESMGADATSVIESRLSEWMTSRGYLS